MSTPLSALSRFGRAVRRSFRQFLALPLATVAGFAGLNALGSGASVPVIALRMDLSPRSFVLRPVRRPSGRGGVPSRHAMSAGGIGGLAASASGRPVAPVPTPGSSSNRAFDSEERRLFIAGDGNLRRLELAA